MREIQLANGKGVALVDDADYEWLLQYSWSMSVGTYAGARVNGRNQYMHRLILGVMERNIHVDHINHNGLDNTRGNLRLCTPSQNQMNAGRRLRPGCTPQSIYKGVALSETGNRWKARMKLNQKTVALGSYLTEIAAAIAYNEAAKKYHGEFARLNEIPDTSSDSSSCRVERESILLMPST